MNTFVPQILQELKTMFLVFPLYEKVKQSNKDN